MGIVPGDEKEFLKNTNLYNVIQNNENLVNNSSDIESKIEDSIDGEISISVEVKEKKDGHK